MMFMANVFYTIAGSVSVGADIFGKARAGMFLGRAKRLAMKAFTAEAETNDLETAVTSVGLMTNLGRLQLSFGDIHILMSCYAQWVTHFKRKFYLPHAYDLKIVEACYRSLKRAPQENLRMLATATFFDLFREDEKAEDAYSEMEKFLRANVPTLYEQEEVSISDLGLVQTVCRVARSVGRQEVASELAAKYGLNDQLKKAHDRE